MKWYKAKSALIAGRFCESVLLGVEGGKFGAVLVDDGAEMERDFEFIDLDGYVVPGFIDQHLHGSIGYDFMDASLEANVKIAQYLPSLGVTSFLATTLTASTSGIQKALAALSDAFDDQDYLGAQCLGVHLEGPFINLKRKGAHAAQWIQRPTLLAYEALVGPYHECVRMVTLAPECDEAHALTRYLTSQGVIVSAGHSCATFEEMEKAHRCGVSCVTHCFNAMSSVTSRDGGVVGAALLIPSLYAEVIADGIHVSDENLQMFARLKSDEQKILVSDAMRARGFEKGEVFLGELVAYFDGEKATLPDGTLAGSVLKPLDGVKAYKRASDETFEKSLRMFSENPARLLGLEGVKGQIAVGYDADFLVLDERFELLETFCHGQSCYRSKDEAY